MPKREPQPAPGLPRCPRHVKGEARREWFRVLRDYGLTGAITRADRAALAAYCLLYARSIQVEALLEGCPLAIKTANGYIQNPLVRIADRTYAEMRAYAVEFGMTPSSRSRVQVPGEVEEDEFTKYLRERDALAEHTEVADR